MALSGNFENLPMSGGHCGLHCDWSAVQSITGNYSDVTVNVYLRIYDIYIPSHPLTISINGDSQTFTIAAISDGTTRLHDVYLANRTVRVYHNLNGYASPILSASFDIQVTYAGTYYSNITASATVTLDNIDRNAPTVQISTSNITANSVTVSATASTNCDRWDYSTDNGNTWINFSTTDGVSVSKTITSLTPNTTYNIKVRARKTRNQVYGISSVSSVKTLGGSVLSSFNSIIADNNPATITMSVTVYNTNYTHKLVLKNGSSVVLTITGLSLLNGINTITLTSETNGQGLRDTLLSAMHDVKSFRGTFELTTYSGSTQIGNVSKKENVLVYTTAANSSPTFSGFSYLDLNDISYAITGNRDILIQNVSSLRVLPQTAMAKNGASISSYSVLAGNVSASSPPASGGTITTIDVGEISEIETNSTITVTVTAIDSRGYSTSRSRDVQVIAYEKIRIANSYMRRRNEIEDTLQVHLEGYISPILIGTIEESNKNRLTYVKYRYQRTDSDPDDWEDWIDVTPGAESTDTSFEYINNELIRLSSEYSYYVEFEVGDVISTDSEIFTISQGVPLIAFRRRKVGINKRDPSSELDVNGNIMMNGMNVMGFIKALDDDDLNDLTSSGIYTQESNAQASSTKHYPNNIAGFLEVIVNNTNGDILQRYTVYNCSVIYIRYYRRDNGWHAWQSITLY